MSWKSDLLHTGRQATAVVLELHDVTGKHADDAVALGVIDDDRRFATWIHFVTDLGRYQIGDQIDVWYDAAHQERIRTRWDANDRSLDQWLGFPALLVGLALPFVARDAIWAAIARRHVTGEVDFKTQIEVGFSRPRARRANLVVVRTPSAPRPYRIAWRPGLPSPGHALGPDGARLIAIIEPSGSTRLARHAVLRCTDTRWNKMLEETTSGPPKRRRIRRPKPQPGPSSPQP